MVKKDGGADMRDKSNPTFSIGDNRVSSCTDFLYKNGGFLPYQYTYITHFDDYKEEKENRMKLYFVAAVYTPTKKEQDDGIEDIIILDPTAVLAKDESVARGKAVELIDRNAYDADEYPLDRVTIYAKEL